MSEAQQRKHAVNLDGVSLRLFHMTREQAHAANVCVRCKADIEPMHLSPLDRAEYRLSAICPTCWLALFPEDDPREATVDG